MVYLTFTPEKKTTCLERKGKEERKLGELSLKSFFIQEFSFEDDRLYVYENASEVAISRAVNIFQN